MAKLESTRQLREKTDAELAESLRKLRKDKTQARFQLAISKLKDHSSYSKARKQIARILTLMNERSRIASQTPKKG